MDTDTERWFPIAAAMLAEKICTRKQEPNEHLSGRLFGPGWNEYADEQMQRAAQLDPKAIFRTLAANINPKYSALFWVAVLHDLPFLSRAG